MSSIIIAGDTSGSVTLQAPAASGSTVLTLPTTSGTLLNNQTLYTYKTAGTPSYNTNPTVANASWLNTTTGEIWMCTNNTTNANVWKLIGYTTTISAATVFDIFGDNSAVALYQFTSGNGTDTGGSYSMTTNTFSSGTGINGTCANGSGSYMKNGNSMNNNLVVSVSAWVNVSDTGNNWVWSSGKAANGAPKRGLRISGLAVTIWNCSEYNNYGSTSYGSLSSGTWTHLCISKDKIYVNGSLAGTMTSYTTPSSDTYGFYIGANGAYDYGYITSETYGQPMNGLIDQMRVFNRELTASEVQLLYTEV